MPSVNSKDDGKEYFGDKCWTWTDDWCCECDCCTCEESFPLDKCEWWWCRCFWWFEGNWVLTNVFGFRRGRYL